MSTVPPPLSSPKRILPAFALCVVLCAHRLYAGKIISGVAQMGLAAAAFFWMKADCGGLIAIVTSGSVDLETLERIGDWQQSHGVSLGPVLASIAVGIWIAVDAGQLVAGKFTDGSDRRITHWL